ncbi:cyclic pyranopterin monophosphate synthase MoaC, partial [Streptomyces sp. NPDC059627]
MTEPFWGDTPGPSVPDRLTHIDDAGAARMVDVSGKDVTARTARASGRVLVSPRVVELLRGGGGPPSRAPAPPPPPPGQGAPPPPPPRHPGAP